jgi:muramidase (phage lysozyme)
MPRISAEQAGGINVAAFLDTIAWSEIGPELLAHSDDGYDVLVGSTDRAPLLFTSYATHPNVYSARFASTAAGRYQELFRNWLAYKAMLKLPDFGPVSQDRMAIQQITEARAMPSILGGDFDTAIILVSHLWASLPGAGYGQHEQELGALRAAYQAAGGQIASLANVTGSAE